MTEISRDLIDQAISFLNAFKEAQSVYGYMGQRIDGQWVFEVPNKPGKVYVRMTQNGRETIATAVNLGAPLNEQLRVEIVRKGNTLVVLGPDPRSAMNVYGKYASTAAVPPHISGIGTSNPDPVESRRFMPGLVYSTNDSVKVSIFEFLHQFGFFEGETGYDLSASVPGSPGARWVGLGLDGETGVPIVVNGTIDSGAASDTLDASAGYALVYDIGYGNIPLGAVALQQGDTTITAATRMLDLRMFVQVLMPRNKYDGTVAPDVTNDDSEGYAPGSIWVDVTGGVAYVCLDASTGAAVWQEVGSGGGIDFAGLTLKTPPAFADEILINDAGVDKRTTLASTLDLFDTRSSPILLPGRRFKEKIVTSTGTVNNLDPEDATVILLNNSSALTITGLAAGQPGQIIYLRSVGSANVFLEHQNTGSSASNRLINIVTSAPSPLVSGRGHASYVYDSNSSRWRMLDHFQGGAISFDIAWSAVTTNPTLGNGTKTAQYEIQRNMCWMYFSITMGSTTTYGTGAWYWTVPVNRVGLGMFGFLGEIGDISAGTIRHVQNNWYSGNDIVLSYDNGNYIRQGLPWTWANGDFITVSGWYRVA